MSVTSVFVKYKDKRVKVNYTSFDSLVRKTKVKFKLLTDFRLEYQNKGWTTVCDDEDLEDISSDTELRLVLEEKKQKKSLDSDESEDTTTACGSESKIPQEGDYVGGDKTTATNFAKIGRVDGGVHFHDGGNSSRSTPSDLDLEEAYKKFKKELLETIEKEATIPNVFHNCKVSIVKLQITSMEQQSEIEERMHLHHRKIRADMMSKNTNGDVEVGELFKKANQLANQKSSMMHFLENSNAQEKFIKEKENFVIISGQAGSGKTTLSKTIVGGNWFDVDIVFYLVLRNVYYTDKTDLLNFLAPTINYQKNQQQITHSILDKLEKSSKVLIIMDGLDESNIDFTTPHPSVNIHDKATAEVFITNLMNGSLLSNAKKLIFSRPQTVSELPDQYKPILVATILGLNHDAQRQICNDICKVNSKNVYQYVKNNADLLAYCKTPLNLILVVYTINESLSNNLNDTPRSFTGILVFVLRLFFDKDYNKEHFRSNFDAKSIASLAWNKFKEDEYSFSLKDFNKDFNPDNLVITFNPKTNLPLLGGNPKTKVFFSHLVLQEFFTAVYLLYFMELEEFEQTFFVDKEFDLTSTKFEIVAKFMFGLSNEKASENIKQIIPSDVHPTQKVDLLKSLIELNVYNNIDDEVLRYFLWAYELNDDNFTQKLALCLSDEVNISCTMLPTDIAAFHYVCGMRKHRPITIQSLTSQDFYGDCWDQFLSDENLNQYLNKMTRLIIADSRIDDEATLALSQCSHKIQNLDLSGCSLTTIGWTRVLGAVAKMEGKMNQLTIEGSDIDDEAALALGQSSHKIQNLDLQYCSLTTIGWTRVFSAVAKMEGKMNQLTINGSDIEDEAALALGQCSHKIQHLDLSGCNLTTIGWTRVFSAVAKMEEKMNWLKIANSRVEDEAGLALGQCSHKIQQLDLSGCNLTTIGWTSVFSAVAKMEEKMKELTINGSNIDDEAALALGQCSHKIQQLDLNGGNLTTIGWTRVFSAVAKMEGKMNQLTIFASNIDDEAALALGQCSHKIQHLDLSGCNLTTIGWTRFFSAVAKMEGKMNQLKFFVSNIDDEAALALGQCSHKIQHLDLTGCSLTTIGWTRFFSAVAKMEEKMNRLAISGSNIDDEAGLALGQCSHKIQQLDLRGCNLSTIGWTSVFSAVAKMEEKMEILDLQYKQSEILDELLKNTKLVFKATSFIRQ